jgi:hypothetical protein
LGSTLAWNHIKTPEPSIISHLARVDKTEVAAFRERRRRRSRRRRRKW